MPLVGVLMLFAAPSAHAQGMQGDCSWMQGDKTPEQRADELIAAMTPSRSCTRSPSATRPGSRTTGPPGHVDGTPELCIPTLTLSDAGSGVAGLQQGTTTFPSGVAQAATWDPRLQRRFGAAIGAGGVEQGHQRDARPRA